MSSGMPRSQVTSERTVSVRFSGKQAKCWELIRTPKYATSGVVRCIPPTETTRRVSGLMSKIGVTRIAEVTHLDRVGIPNFMAVRPRDCGPGISYYNGKGSTREAAKAGAMMEAIERFCGEQCDLQVFYCSYQQIKKRGPSVDPADIIMPKFRDYHPSDPLEWVEGFELISRKPIFVPLNSVICPYEPKRNCALYYGSTNGLASGNTLEEALCHAICEVIERDALAMSCSSLELAPAVQQILASFGRTSNRSTRAPLARFPLIELDSLPAGARRLTRKLQSAGLKTYLRDITCTAGIPTLDCAIVEPLSGGRHLVHGGCGTHPDARVALCRALTEAAQSRIACIQGGREDLTDIVMPPIDFEPEETYGKGERRPYSSINSFEYDNVDDDVRFLVNRLKTAGFTQIATVNLTRPEIGVPVVRVIVPKAEAWTVFHSHTGRGVFGTRVANALTAN
jgi:ribosomal protein S12 methylthiotransferase accessory factor